MSTEELNDIPKTNWKQGYILAGAVFVIWILSAIAVYFVSKEWSVRGQFGDMFGAVNALFSGLAFAGLIYTIILQREELSLQRKELALTRDELKRSAEAQEETSKALNTQIHSMSVTAKINALTTVINYHKHVYETEKTDWGIKHAASNSIKEAVQKITQYMNEI